MLSALLAKNFLQETYLESFALQRAYVVVSLLSNDLACISEQPRCTMKPLENIDLHYEDRDVLPFP
jgi:hypothetical protein